MRARSLLLIAATALLSLTHGSAHARSAPTPSDSQARAAIIYNFTRFSSWDAGRFATPSSPVVLCVEPGHALSGHLAALEGRPVGDRTLRVRRTAVFDEGCHAAVLGPASSSAANLASLARDGVLTIGDTPGFIAHGAIGMITVGRQIRFEINNRNARVAGVVLSSRLLRLAVVVR